MLANIMKRDADNSYEASEKLKGGPLAMAKDYEWDEFVIHSNQMVDPRVPLRQSQNITYMGKDHPAAIEVKSGMLERKSKYLKNYTPGWSVPQSPAQIMHANVIPGMFCRQLISMSSSPQTRLLPSLPSCLCTYQSKSWAHIRNLVPTLTNSCSRDDRLEVCIVATAGSSVLRLMTQ